MYPRPSFPEKHVLNFAENLLYPQTPNSSPIDPSSPAVIEATETTRVTLSWDELRARVGKCTRALKDLGVSAHDVIAGYVANHANAVVYMLSATGLGAIWTGVSPDCGVGMVKDRLCQVKPKVLIADSSQEYNGKIFDVISKVREIVEGLDDLRSVIVLSDLSKLELESEGLRPVKGAVESHKELMGGDLSHLSFSKYPPDHPVYILYSSGTTGAPKCIAHGAIGTLLQHKKEHCLHCDIKPGDRMFYFTTCTWMM